MKPLYDCIKKYSNRKTVRFHMPAHCGKKIGQILSEFDLTELSCTDNMLSPTAEIKQAQELLAKAYNSKKSYFVTSGTTTSLFVMLNSVKKLGDSIIIERNCHKSVYNALAILNLNPIILPCRFEDGLAIGADVKDIEKLLKDFPNVAGVLITTPDYFGRIQDLSNISKLLKKKNKLLLVDNAHGAHFPFFPMLSNSVSEFADIYVSSPHKTMPVLTGGSCIHVNNENLIDQIEIGLNLFHSTSPSYLVMASMDFAREYLTVSTKTLVKITDMINNFKDKARQIGIEFLMNDDILRIVMSFKNLKINPAKVDNYLSENNIFVEFSNENYIVLIVSVFSVEKDFVRLFKVLNKAIMVLPHDYELVQTNLKIENKSVVPYLTAINSDNELINLNDAENRVCAINVGIYPPAFPLVIAGEVFTRENIEILKNADKSTFCVAEHKVCVLK